MNALFVHDHFFKYKEDLYYSSGGLPYSVWHRYLAVFDSLVVVGRDGGVLKAGDDGYTISSHEGVIFKLQPDVSNLKSFICGNAFVKKNCTELVAKCDALIVRLPSHLGQIFVKEAIRQNKPYALEVVGCVWDALFNYGGWKAKALAPIELFSMKRTIANANFVLYVTKSFLQKRYPCTHGHTVNCSNVEITPVDAAVLKDRINRIQNFKSPLKFGLIGNYSSKYKGIDIAIRALAHADRKLPPWELHILGSGDSSFYMSLSEERGVADRVKFVGRLEAGEKVHRWLDTIDIYLQPSLQEGLPRGLIEAMSRGCPSVASSIAGIPELLSTETMFPVGDYRKLAVIILWLASDRKMLANLAECNFLTAQDYCKSEIDSRRLAFWSDFYDHIASSL